MKTVKITFDIPENFSLYTLEWDLGDIKKTLEDDGYKNIVVESMKMEN